MSSLVLAQKKKKKEEPKMLESFKVHCSACHLPDRVQVGPHFVELQELYPKSKRKEFIEWCYKPGKVRPESPQMPAMIHVPEKDLIEIHDYILKQQIKRLKKSGNTDLYPDTERPRVVRTFMPDCGPASLYVAFPTKDMHNLIWDTDRCRLRYISAGEVDNYPYLRSNGNSLANTGKKVYTEKKLFDRVENLQFDGYQMGKDGYPTFIYRLNGATLKERLSMDGEIIIRTITSTAPLPKVVVSDHKTKTLKTTVKVESTTLTIQHEPLSP